MEHNKFAEMPLPKLLRSMAVPAIIANVVNSLYNIVDQIFIGQGIGYLGNAATSVAFPLTTICLAFGLMCGIGAASNFNLCMGKGEEESASKMVGNGIRIATTIGVIVLVAVLLLLKPILLLFGATDATMGYAISYTRITAIGIPFLMFTFSVNPLIRADGSSTYSMMGIVIGAVLNTILDPIFIFVFDWGIRGAAIATLISQVVAALCFAKYLFQFQSVTLTKSSFELDSEAIRRIISFGSSSFIFQFSMMIIQVVTNNMLRSYGRRSVYGSDVTIAIAGIVTKVNSIFIAVIIGLVQGAQPIFGFNYGAKNLERVQGTLKLLWKSAFAISLIAFLGFEIFPRQILELFGSGSDLYFQFGIKFIRIFLIFTMLNGIQISSTTFFQAIGRAKIGALLSLIKQVIVLLPLIVILPYFFGVDGVIYAGPAVDIIAFSTTMIFLRREWKRMPADLSV